MSMSLRTMALLEKRAQGDPEDFFSEGFQELALHRILTEMPELSEKILSFKILDVDMDAESAVGTFILAQGTEEVHVPVILAGNTLAPFDIMYVKSIDKYLPLTEEWLLELERMDASRMGQAVTTPEGLQSDQDIRNVVVPPTTGRYSYASAGKTLLPTYLAGSHDMVKQSFLRTLERHPKIAKYVFEHYDHKDLEDAVRPTAVKTASTASKLNFVTIETPSTETRALFHDATPKAMEDIAQKGYAVHDIRERTNKAITEEHALQLHVPDSAGFYRVFLSDGSSPRALIFPKVLSIDGLYAKSTPEAMRPEAKSPDGDRLQETHSRQVRLIYMEDGRFMVTKNDFVAQPLPLTDVGDKLMSFIKSNNPRTPRNGQRGFFCKTDHKNILALEPLKITHVTSQGDTRHIRGYSYSSDAVQIIQVKDSRVTLPKCVGGRDPRAVSEWVGWDFQTEQERKDRTFDEDIPRTILVPWEFKFVPVSEVVDPTWLLRNPEAVTSVYYKALKESGAETVTLKNAGAGQLAWGVDLLTPFEAIQKLASVYGVNIPDAEHVVKVASTRSRSNVYIVTPEVESAYVRRIKTAYAGAEGMPPEGMPPEGMPPEGMPPEGMAPEGMPPEGMAPPPMQPPMPPPPSPVAIAAQEIAQQVMQSGNEVMNQLMQQQQSLETQLGAIQAVMDRAQQIEAEQMGYDAGPPVGAPPVQPPPPPAAGDPAAEAMGAPPQGAEGPMGAPQGMPPGPGAGMPVEQPMAMEEAMQLEDPELFDAAAIATIAEQNTFDASVLHFIPVFQEALDALGRILMELRIKAHDLKNTLGEIEYSDLSDTVTMLFERLGTLVVQLDEVTANAEVEPE